MSGTAWSVLGLMAVLGFWALGAHNRLVRLRQAIVQCWVAVDAQLQRRHAMARELAERLAVPEAEPAVGDELARSAVQMLAAAVRQAETVAAQARLRAAHAGTIQSLAMAEQVLDNALRPLALLVQARSRRLQRAGLHEALRELLESEADIEDQLAFARRLFNTAVAEFNQAIDELPTRLLAAPMRLRPAASFQGDRSEGARPAPPPVASPAPAPDLGKDVLALPVVEMTAPSVRPIAPVEEVRAAEAAAPPASAP